MPTELTILGKRYSVLYFDRLVEVDCEGRDALAGQIDFEKREIRLFKGTTEDILQALFHEVLHAFEQELHFTIKHKSLDLISLGLVDCLLRNDLLKVFNNGKEN